MQARTNVRRSPLTVGLNLMHNSEDYSATNPDPLTAFHRDETDGYDFYATLGQVKNRGDWLFGAY